MLYFGCLPDHCFHDSASFLFYLVIFFSHHIAVKFDKYMPRSCVRIKNKSSIPLFYSSYISVVWPKSGAVQVIQWKWLTVNLKLGKENSLITNEFLLTVREFYKITFKPKTDIKRGIDIYLAKHYRYLTQFL